MQPQRLKQEFDLRELTKDGTLARLVVGDEAELCYVAVRGEQSSTVAEVSYASGRIARLLATGRNPDRLVLSGDGRELYCTDRDDGTLSIVSLESGNRTSIPLGKRPHGLAVSPDGRAAYIGSLDGTIYHVALETRTMLEAQLYPGSSFADLAVTTDGLVLAAVDHVQNRLRLARTTDITEWFDIPLPRGPTCLRFDPVLRRFYCTCQDDPSLAIVAFTGHDYLSGHHRVTRVPLAGPGMPIAPAISPNAERVFITIQDPPALAVFYVDTWTWYPRLELSLNPINVQATPDSGTVLITTPSSLVRIATTYGFGTHPNPEPTNAAVG